MKDNPFYLAFEIVFGALIGYALAWIITLGVVTQQHLNLPIETVNLVARNTWLVAVGIVVITGVASMFKNIPDWIAVAITLIGTGIFFYHSLFM